MQIVKQNLLSFVDFVDVCRFVGSGLKVKFRINYKFSKYQIAWIFDIVSIFAKTCIDSKLWFRLLAKQTLDVARFGNFQQNNWQS